MRPATYRRRACELLEVDELPVTDELICGTMLLAACRVGARVRKLADETGWAYSRVKPIFDRLRRQGVFTENGKVAVEWAHEDCPHPQIAFLLDVACGVGLVERR